MSVSDSGPGIAEADQVRIFEKFYQVDPSLTKESYGTGLGLAIAKELTGLLGGRLTLESSPGHGATFTLFLPLEPPQAAVEAAQKAPAAAAPPTDAGIAPPPAAEAPAQAEQAGDAAT